MREQLIQYVELLFAGAPDGEDIKQEILQNTLDRYDDLVESGKVPEAAYRLAIAGIGDVNEILGTPIQGVPVKATVPDEKADSDTPIRKLLRAIAVGLYILCPLPLIVLSEMGNDTMGLCGLLAIVAVATVLIMLGAKKDSKEENEDDREKPESELVKSVSGVLWAVGIGVYLLLSFTSRAWHITWVVFPILVALDTLVSTVIENKENRQSEHLSADKQKVRKSIAKLIWAVGLAIYFLFSFATNAWYISWLIFPIIGAVQGLTTAIMDLKEAMEHET